MYSSGNLPFYAPLGRSALFWALTLHFKPNLSTAKTPQTVLQEKNGKSFTAGPEKSIKQ